MPKMNFAVINCQIQRKEMETKSVMSITTLTEAVKTRRLHSLHITIQIILFSKHIEECRIKK